MTPGPVRAETDRVVCAATLCLVLRVARQISQFVHAMGELTLIAIFAVTAFFKRPAQLGFVAGRIDPAAAAVVPIQPVMVTLA